VWRKDTAICLGASWIICFVNLPRIQPINPGRIAAAFDHPDWLFELKHDGYSAAAHIENGKCELVSRKNIVYKSVAAFTSMMAKLPVKNAILDGVLDLRRKSREACFYAFDLLWPEGEDLRWRWNRHVSIGKAKRYAVFEQEVVHQVIHVVLAKDDPAVVAIFLHTSLRLGSLSWVGTAVAR